MSGRLQAVISNYRQQLLHHEAQAQASLSSAHAATLKKIQPHIDKLTKQIGDAQQSGHPVPLHFLYEQNRLQVIKAWISGQIDQYGALAKSTTIALKKKGVQLGEQSALDQLDATLPESTSYSFGVPSQGAIESIVGATQKGSPLADLFNGFGAEAAQKVGQVLISAITLGDNPRKIARDIEDALDISRSRALTIARTEMLRAYRESALETYRANDDVVEGWLWMSALDARTCFPAGVLVQTKRGSIPIEQVKIGDEVLTHEGRYKRVYETLQRPYSGDMITVRSGNNSVVATSNHPFLVERQGKLNWIEAGKIRLTDHVICQRQGATEIVDHSLSDRSIEGSIRQSDHTVAFGLKPKRFSLISLFDARLGMPIQTINLKTGIKRWKKEINRIAPTLKGMLLSIFNSQGLKTKTSVLFRPRFSCMSTIASNRTKASPNSFSRCCSELLSAINAGIDGWWSSAFFRAMFIAGIVLIKNLPASFTGDIDYLRSSTSFRAVDIPILTGHDSKGFVANRASFSDMGMGFSTFQTAKILLSAVRKLEKFPTILASSLRIRFSNLPSSSMRMLTLESCIALLGAEPSIPFTLPSFGNDKLFPAFFTGQFDPFSSVSRFPSLAAFWTTIGSFLSAIANVNPSVFFTEGTDALDTSPVTFDIKSFHASIISQHNTHVQRNTTVYNIEVEDDHSYVANGFVVHNCAVCISMHGSVHSLDEDLDGHPNCRCTKSPRVKGSSFAPLLGSDWFDDQPEAVQRQILGSNAAYEAYDSGASLSDFVGVNHDKDWGSSVYQKSAKEVNS